MADIEVILGADNGHSPADKLAQMYPKINRNFAEINAELAQEEADRAEADEAHAESETAHPAENITYEGEVDGADNVKAAIDTLKTVVDAAIVEGDSSPQASAASVSISGTTYPTLKGRLDAEYTGVTAQLAETDQQLTATGLALYKVNRGFAAHRGLQAYAPENTIKALAAAGQYGYVMVEIDTQPTADGVWILMHDSTVDRTTDGTGAVSGLSWAAIQALHIDTPAYQISEDEVIRVPTLEDALREIAYWGMGVNIDGSKFAFTPSVVTYLTGLLDKYDLTSKSWIVCPTYADRQMLKQYAPHVTAGWVSTPANVDNDIAEAAEYRRSLVGYNSAALTDTVIAKCNNAGVMTLAYTANDVKTAYQWLNRGVTFVETDYVLPGAAV